MLADVVFLTSDVRPASIGLGFMVQGLGADDRQIAKMAQQVKDVLPHVPLNVITKDLGKTVFKPSPSFLLSSITCYLLCFSHTLK